MTPTFFETPAAFRRWLAKHHESATELLVGFHKVDSGKKSMTWPESVDEALCFGWIDGVRRRLDDTSYTIRFTPRRAQSKWSKVNLKRFDELRALGRIQPAGLAAFERGKPAVYSYAEQPRELSPEYEEKFRADAKAWKFWAAQPPGYRRWLSFHVMSAKQEATRERRLQRVMDASRRNERIGLLTPAKK
ncbi:MAG: YdeI/OmpD-associated family protein [Acidobacteria bacterium]|nr:YdeI/OmpD-associated family protein [Acidobacteriota bacterium]MBV9478658.1 YdeI/OmpD-associated family protein [Acidobacteriota bacterium]